MSVDPILFLDIDGVLNSADWLGRQVRESPPPELMCDARNVDPLAVARLNRIVEATGCRVVLSSTWRLLHSLDEMNAILGFRGARFEIFGVTPDGWATEGPPLWKTCQRGAEIQMWRAEHGHTGPFVVLDDENDMDAVREHLVRTGYQWGLTDALADEAIAVLRG